MNRSWTRDANLLSYGLNLIRNIEKKLLEEKPHILIVDDDPLVLDSLNQVFMDDYIVAKASSGLEAIEQVKKGTDLGVIILDIRMAGMDGFDTAEQIKRIDPRIPIVFYSGYPGDFTDGQIDRDYQPFDFVMKNEAPSRLIRTVHNAVKMHNLQSGKGDLVSLAKDEYGMVGRSHKMLDVFETIENISPTESKVMILGPTGSGKELVARAIHAKSRRQSRPLAILNCNHKPADLIESELFGHLKGSFTGAVIDRLGLFEYADGGTVFLDEIGDLDMNSQTKLLRVIETGEMRKIGAPDSIKVDVRILCATHHHLGRMVEEKRFREDLFYRLKGVTISLPPLEDRREDIPDLIDYFMERHCKSSGIPLKIMEPTARDLMIEYEWPGNVRQLKDTIEALANLTPSSYISRREAEAFLEYDIVSSHTRGTYSDQIRAAKKTIIVKALARNYYNISAAARELQIDRSNLHKLVKDLGLNVGNNTTQ